MSDSDWTSTVGGVPKRSQGSVPNGWYTCEVDRVQLKDWESGRGVGKSVKVEFRIIEGDERNRRIIGSHIVKYESTIGEETKAAFAQRMGRAQYMALVHALGFDQKPESLEALVQRSCKVEVKYNEKRNELEVCSYRSCQ